MANIVMSTDRLGLVRALQEMSAADLTRTEQRRQLIRALRAGLTPGHVAAAGAISLTVGLILGLVVGLLVRKQTASQAASWKS